MEIISIESKALIKLISSIENLTREISKLIQTNNNSISQLVFKDNSLLDNKWLDNEAVCKLLNVSKRTLQNYRDNFVLPYSLIKRKIFYKSTDVQKILENHYIPLDSS